MGEIEAAAVVAEVIGWIALIGAALFGIAVLILRIGRGPWDSAPAVVTDGEIRWMSADGRFHASPAPREERPGDDDFMVFYRTRWPGVYYLERVAPDERTLSLVSLTLAGVGLIALVVNTVTSLM